MQRRTLLLGKNDNQLMNALVNRMGPTASVVFNVDGEDDPFQHNTYTGESVSSIVLIGSHLSKTQEELLNRLQGTNPNITMIRVVSFQESIQLTRSHLDDDQPITIHAPLIYEDLIADRQSFFIHNIDTHQNIVKYYGNSELRLPLISREDLISYIVTVIKYKPTKKNVFIRGDLLRLESIVTSLFGRGFQFENVIGRPGEERLALRYAQLVRMTHELVSDNQLFPMVHPLRWTEFLTH